jgi:ABC-type molybdate transport system substrate-binding protein
MPTAVVLDIKCWTADDTSRQSLLSLAPSFTSELFTRRSLSIAASGSVTVPCGKKFIMVSSNYPVTYSIDSGSTMTGQIFMLTLNNETRELTLTAGASATKVIYISVD